LTVPGSMLHQISVAAGEVKAIVAVFRKGLMFSGR
jgi:hypothetical protein